MLLVKTSRLEPVSASRLRSSIASSMESTAVTSAHRAEHLFAGNLVVAARICDHRPARISSPSRVASGRGHLAARLPDATR